MLTFSSYWARASVSIKLDWCRQVRRHMFMNGASWSVNSAPLMTRWSTSGRHHPAVKQTQDDMRLQNNPRHHVHEGGVRRTLVIQRRKGGLQQGMLLRGEGAHARRQRRLRFPD